MNKNKYWAVAHYIQKKRVPSFWAVKRYRRLLCFASQTNKTISKHCLRLFWSVFPISFVNIISMSFFALIISIDCSFRVSPPPGTSLPKILTITSDSHEFKNGHIRCKNYCDLSLSPGFAFKSDTLKKSELKVVCLSTGLPDVKNIEIEATRWWNAFNRSLKVVISMWKHPMGYRGDLTTMKEIASWSRKSQPSKSPQSVFWRLTSSMPLSTTKATSWKTSHWFAALPAKLNPRPHWPWKVSIFNMTLQSVHNARNHQRWGWWRLQPDSCRWNLLLRMQGETLPREWGEEGKRCLWAEGGVARVWIFRDSIVRGKNRNLIIL